MEEKERRTGTAGVTPAMRLYLGVCLQHLSACHTARPLHQAAVDMGKLSLRLMKGHSQ